VPYQDEVLGAWSVGYAGFVILGLATSLWANSRSVGRVLERRRERRAGILSITFGCCLFFVIARFLGIPFLGWQLWFPLTAFIGIIATAYLGVLIRMQQS
jgi:hypothetical protein